MLNVSFNPEIGQARRRMDKLDDRTHTFAVDMAKVKTIFELNGLNRILPLLPKPKDQSKFGY
jgi:hypothetical protein